MSAAEDLELALDRGHDAAAGIQDEPGFVIDNLDKATWAVRRIAWHRTRLAEAAATATRERQRVDSWLADETRRHDTSYLEALLRRYHEQRIGHDNPGAASWDDVKQSKTVHTPAGDLVARKSPDRVDVDDTVFVPWALTQAEDLLHPPKDRTPDKAAIRKAVGPIMADGQVVDAVTGVFLPGVTWIEGDVTYTVKTPEADQ